MCPASSPCSAIAWTISPRPGLPELFPDLFDDALAPVPAPAISSPKETARLKKKLKCRFCPTGEIPRPVYVDYKDVGLLKKLCTNQSKMFSRKRSGNCAAFQRAASDAVKRARFMALIPYVGE